MKQKNRCLDCAYFTKSHVENHGACFANPIPRRGICGVCKSFYDRQGKL